MPEEAKVSKFESMITDLDLRAIIIITYLALREDGMNWRPLMRDTKLDEEQLARLNMKVTFAAMGTNPQPDTHVLAVQDRHAILTRLQNLIRDIHEAGDIPLE